MLTRGQMLIVKAGQTAKLECEFISETFSLFDNPVVWRKTQRVERSQINMMGNLLEPFASARRFRATYQPYSPRYVFGLTIESKHTQLLLNVHYRKLINDQRKHDQKHQEARLSLTTRAMLAQASSFFSRNIEAFCN